MLDLCTTNDAEDHIMGTFHYSRRQLLIMADRAWARGDTKLAKQYRKMAVADKYYSNTNNVRRCR